VIQDVAVRAEQRGLSVQLADERGRGGRRALGKRVGRLERHAAGVRKRLDGLDAAGVRAGEDAGKVDLRHRVDEPLRLTPPATVERPVAVVALPGGAVACPGVADEQDGRCAHRGIAARAPGISAGVVIDARVY
jgi:hypothetical protein